MDNRDSLNDEPNRTSALTPLVAHKAFINLINYYNEQGFGNLYENPNLQAREENINIFFPVTVMNSIDSLIPYANSVIELHKISDVNNTTSRSDLRACIAEIGNTINTLIQPTDSCGESANHTARLFLDIQGSELIPNQENKPSFNLFEGEDNTMLAEVMSHNDTPVLIRIDVARLVNDIETTTHSYCAFVAKEENEFGVAVYQAYFGQYTLGEWFNDPKFKTQPVNFEEYIKQLENLTSNDSELRKKTYGQLYRLTGSENEVPDKPKLNVYYKMLPVDLSLAMTNIHANMEIAKKLESEVIHQNNGNPITPMEFLQNICWKSLNDYPSEKIKIIRTVVEAYQAEIQKNLDRFTQLSQTPAAETSSSSRPDEWRRFDERHSDLSSYNPSTTPNLSVLTRLPTNENNPEEQNKNDVPSPKRS